MIKINHVREVIVKNRANQTTFEQLKEEKAAVEVELMSIKVTYSSLKEKIQGGVLLLGFNDKLLETTYNQVDTLKWKILEVNTTQDSLRVELFVVREEAQSSQLWFFIDKNKKEMLVEILVKNQ